MGYGVNSLVEYRVAAFEAELAFWRDRVGMRVVVDEPDYAIVAGADGRDFRLALRRDAATASGVSVQFFVPDLAREVERLAARGLAASDRPRAYDAAHPGLMTCGYRTPAGLSLRLWQESTD